MLLKNQRLCPKCNKIITYSKAWVKVRADKVNSHCRECKNIKWKYKQKISNETEQLIVLFHSQGKSKKYIRDKLGIGDKPINRVYRENKLIKNKAPRLPVYDPYANKRVCNKCNILKPIEAFRVFLKAGDGTLRRNGACMQCIVDRQKKHNRSTVEIFLRYCYSNIKTRAKKEGVIFDLQNDKNYLLKLFRKQKGKCFYTDQLLTWDGNDRKTAISVDKIIPNKGYIKDNIVLCTRRINTVKNDLSLEEIEKWMPTWFKRIRKFIERGKI